LATQIDSAVQRQVGVLFNAGTMVPLTDGTLIERFATRRDEAAFAAIVERHGPMVLRVCRAAVRDEHEAYDAFQAAFLVLVRKARSLWVGDSIGPWLHGVAWRIASRARAAAARRRRHEQRAAEMAPRTLIENREARDVELPLHEEIHRLPDRFRAVVILCDLEGLGTDEAAHRLGTPVGTARSRLARGRERLRARLIRRGFGPAVVATVTAQTASSATHLPSAFAQTTIRAAVEFARVGTVSAHLSWMMKGGHEIMTIKAWTMASLVVATGIVAGAGALVAQTSSHGPTVAKPEAKAKAPSIIGATPKPSDTSTDLVRLQGRWKAVRVLENGRVKIDALEQNLAMTVRADTLELSSAQDKAKWQIHQIDEKTSPLALQVSMEGGSKDRAWWIYAFTDDTLRINLAPLGLGDRRPKSFDDYSNDMPFMVIDFIRDEPPKAVAPADTPKKPADSASTDLRRMQGLWAARKIFANGKEIPYPSDKVFELLIYGDEMTYIYPNRTNFTHFRFEIDANSEPRAIRMLSLDGERKDDIKFLCSIYSFQGDVLRMASNNRNYEQRPKSFEDFGQGIHALSTVEYVRQDQQAPKTTPPSETKKIRSDTAEADRERLLGNWIVRKAKVNGREVEGSALALATLTFDRNEVLFVVPGQSLKQMAYRIDPDARPKAFRVANLEASLGDPGVWLYAFADGENGGLKVAFNLGKPRRPKGFDDFDPNRPLTVLELDRDNPPHEPKITGAVKPIETNPTPSTGGESARYRRDNLSPPAHKAEEKPGAGSDDDLARLKGTWKVLAWELNGEDLTKESEDSMIIAGNTLVSHLAVNKSRVTEVFTFTIDSSHDPKTIDLVDVEGSKPMHGIFRIDGPTLMICWAVKGRACPTEFETKPDSDRQLFVLRRKKPARQPVASPSPSATAK